MKELLYGVAYYDEYMPSDRLEKDIELLKAAGINTVRIAESTWSTLEPQNGVFDFTSIDRVLDAMYNHGIYVIVGTPTYAVPTWMVREHPDVLAITKNGQNKYGPRQNMDITNPKYLFYAERVIRRLMSHVKDHPAIIGYQADNETKHYGTSGPNVQLQFVKYMKKKYKTTEAMNKALGLDYWSNRINAWEDFPNVDSTINASLSGDFSEFQRQLVTDFLKWQASIINEYKQEGQFVTHNFDFDWRGFSYGIQPDVDHFQSAKAFDIAGVDIYHPTQDDLTGCEISFCGDMARSMKQDNYLVLETQAQGFAGWLPYTGQLRLQAFSHLASGANMVAYWHYHSIHNSFETYWKGLLSQDFEPNPTYNEAVTIGKDFARLSQHLVNMKRNNKVGILFSNIALSGMNWFKMFSNIEYNDILRQMYFALYRLNVGCDFLDPSRQEFEDYDMIVVPPLYAADHQMLERLNHYVEGGGHVIYGIRSGYSDEQVKVRETHQPGVIGEACGIYYSQFTEAKKTKLGKNKLGITEAANGLSHWIELITPKGAQVLAYYDHPYWGEYAAITKNNYGKGTATYIGCCPEAKVYSKVMENVLKTAGLWGVEQEIPYPVVIKNGISQSGKQLHYIFNYSMEEVIINYPYGKGYELIRDQKVEAGETVHLEAWGIWIVEE